MARHCQLLGALWGLILVLPGMACGQAAPNDQGMVKGVWERLLAAVDDRPSYGAWPPDIEVVNGKRINAFATARLERKGNDILVVPRVVVDSTLLAQVVRDKDDPKRDADRLAYILGHELSHVLLGHVVERKGETPAVRHAFTRDQETAADLRGMQLALRAGYSFAGGCSALKRMIRAGLEYSSFEALGTDHPSWKERLAHLDKEHAALWQSMSAFGNGNVFLLAEQYAAATDCFKRVTDDFPDCPEAWANLGYARLMRYCDKLDARDLRTFGVGLVVTGSFYRRPSSLESKFRGIDTDLWDRAEEALNKALEIKPDLALARANLGVAYLFHKEARPDVEQATKYLREAATAVAADPRFDAAARAAVLINAAAADLAADDLPAARAKFVAAEKAFGGAKFPGAEGLSIRPLDAALWHLAALLTARGGEKEKQAAVGLFEKYLLAESPASPWWTLGYERYAALCKSLNVPARAPAELKDRGRDLLRQVVGVRLGDQPLTLSEPLGKAAQALGKAAPVPIDAGGQFVWLHDPAHQLEVLAGHGKQIETKQILAIRLRGPKAPPVSLQKEGLGAAAQEVRVGMRRTDFEAVLAPELWITGTLVDPGLLYRFYPGIGLGARLDNDTVAELVIARPPRVR